VYHTQVSCRDRGLAAAVVGAASAGQSLHGLMLGVSPCQLPAAVSAVAAAAAAAASLLTVEKMFSLALPVCAVVVLPLVLLLT
jgi:uncharacterized protein (DUF697 family)